MKASFEAYLNNIKLGDRSKNRVEEIINFYNHIDIGVINDIFVNSYIKQDNTVGYDSLWIFTELYFCEAHNFLTADDFDLAIIKNNIIRWDIVKKDFDFNETNDKSRLRIKILLNFPELTGTFNAVKENCKYLATIHNKYFMKNILNI